MPSSGIAGSYDNSFFIFLRDLHTVLQVTVSIYIHTNSLQEGSLSPHSLQHFLFVAFLDDDPSDWCEVILHCSFDLHFSSNQLCPASFQVPVGHLHFFFEEMSILGLLFQLGYLLFSLLSFMNCLYILEIKPLLVASFANISSRSVGCLFGFGYGFLYCAEA